MITWRIVGTSLTPETGGVPTYTVSYSGDPIVAPVTIQLDPIFPGGRGGANPEGSGGANPSDYVGTFAASVDLAIAALPPGSGITFNPTTFELTFSPGGATSLTFTLPIAPDTEPEPAENNLVRIQNPSEGTIESGFDGALTAIVDDDGIAGQRLWSITGDYAALEGQAPRFTVTLAGDALATGATASVQLLPQFQSGLNLADATDFAQAFAADVQAAIAALPPGSGVSYDSGTGRLTFTGGGLTSFEFTLPTLADGTFEGDEIYLVNLGAPSAGTALANSAESVFSIIVDRDAVSEGVEWLIAGTQLVAEGGVPSYTVKWKGEISGFVSIELGLQLPGGTSGATAADFSAAFDADVAAAIAALPPATGITYDPATNRLTFPASAQDFTFTLPTLDDLISESLEGYAVTLSNPSEGRIIETLGGIVTRIADNEGLPDVLIGDGFASEGQPLIFDMGLSNPSSEPITLELAATSGTALGGVDFETANFEYSTDGGLTWVPGGGASGREVTFPAGVTGLVVRIDTIDDPITEDAESMTLSVSAVVSGTIGNVTRTGTGTIFDNDAPPTVTIGDAQATEGQPLVFDVTLSNPSASPIILRLATANGTATGNSDFETSGFEVSTDGGVTWTPAGGGTDVTFSPGATALKVRIDTTDDAIAEGTEMMGLRVAQVIVGTVGDATDTGSGTILDSDAPPSVTIGNAQASEGQPLVFDITLSNPSAGNITLQLAATNGTATGGLDFETSSFEVSTDGGITWAPAGGLDGREVTFAAGATALKVRLETSDDTLTEGSETMSLAVSSVVAGTIGAASPGTGTILDNDAAPNVTIGNAQATEGQPLVFDVALSNGSASPITLELAAADGTALGGSDFETASFEVSSDGGATWSAAGGSDGRQVTFAMGETALKVRVDTTDDAFTESSETMALAVSSVVSGAVGTTSPGTGTILDNDEGVCRLLINEVGLGVATAPSGEKCLSYVEIHNAGGGACSASELACYRLEIQGPCGDKSVVKFGSFHPAVTVPAGAFLVIYENGEYKTVGADGTLITTGTWDGDCDGWELGSSVAEAIGVNLLIKGGDSVDAFFANGMDRCDFRGHPVFEGVDAPQGMAKLAHLAGVDRALFKNGDFNGWLGDAEAVRDALGFGRKLERWSGDAEALKVYARVFGNADGAPIDTDTAADWTTSGLPTDGRYNSRSGDANPGDAADDLDPRQNAGSNPANAGQTVLLAAIAGASVEGGRGPDFLYGDDRDNVMSAGDHNDLAVGGRGNDHLRGGAGADVLIDIAGRDVLAGDSGDDILIAARRGGHWRGGAEPGADVLIGDSVATAGDTSLASGRDVILAGDLDDLIFGDTLLLDAASRAAFDAGLAADQAALLISANLAAGGDPALHTNGAGDWIEAGGGNDFVFGQGGDDRIRAGAGDDIVDGGAGEDDIRGQDGNDVLIGGPGADALHGGAGADVLFADPREDIVLGGGGKDTLALTMGGTLDLAGLAGTSIQSIEQIDMRGGGDLNLTLSVDDVLAMSGSGRLTVLGDGGDVLSIDAAGHSVETHTSGGFVVHVIDDGAAVLRLDPNLNVVGI